VIIESASSANELYAAVCDAVHRCGRPASPRGLSTIEVLGAHLRLTDPRRRLVDLPPHRVLNPAFALAEALWILSGSDEGWIFTFNRALEQYADDGRLHGAYGPRIRHWNRELDQLARVRGLLTADPDSRQAVIQIYDPGRDTRGFRDVPCTLNYRFFLRDGLLQMHTTMRSNDVWLGLPYDLFTATLLQEIMAGWLGVGLGAYHHRVDSLHLYTQHLDSAREIFSRPVTPSTRMAPLAAPSEAFTTFLNTVIHGGEEGAGSFAEPWASFAAVLGSYRAWSAGDRDTARQRAEEIDGMWGALLRQWYTHLTAPAAPAAAGW
jgi:thymidylate synthase